MDITQLSSAYHVRRLLTEDVASIYQLCRGNEIFYRYHPPFVTKESIRKDMAALPPGKDDRDKYYIGFFKGEALVAIMDLILDYPAKGAAFIGLLMVDLKRQKKGTGSKIITECLHCLKRQGFHQIRLGVDRHNPQSRAFWEKNGFTAIGEDQYVVMERII